MIGIALVVGSSKVFDQFTALQQEFNDLCSNCCKEGFSETVKEFVITVFVSGEVEEYEIIGCNRLRYQKRGQRLRIDIGIPIDMWSGAEESQIRAILADFFHEALHSGVQLLAKKGEPVPSSETIELIESAINKFRTENGADVI